MQSQSKFINILLADDDEDDRELFEMAIKEIDAPANVTFIVDGEKLLTYLDKNKKPDIVFLDLNMPLKSGAECLEEIRKKEKFKKLPIIILSTSKAQRDIDKCYQLGANFYIVKPFSPTELSSIIKNILNTEWLSDFTFWPKDKFVYKGKY